MPAPRVLISDALSPAAVQIFKDRGIEVDFQPDLGKDKDKLSQIIGDYDGLAIRSATKVTAKILEQAKNLKVIAYDPFLSPERAVELGVEKVELDDLLRRADIITLHVPMTEKTKNVLSAENLARTKKGVRIINCARGGLVDEAALRAALDSGHVAGAALHVFTPEPAPANPLLGHPHVGW